ncbi:MAG: prepilin-type N-terminal cleavage/methylation domain-containing protein [Planctomycetes bacterium]|nr:prepilin-type N-terminal cleavage/methylation domain-containing protein [Planctomycetota bacterium]
MCLRTNQRLRRPGFTLVELLVVVSVIMLLMAMLLPALQGGSSKAREVKCISNVGQIAKAVVSYLITFDSFLPSPAHVTLPLKATFTELNATAYFDGDRTLLETEKPKLYWYKSYTWRGKVMPFLGASAYNVRDELRLLGGYYEPSENEADRYGIMRCAAARDFRGHQSFYGMNGYLAMYTQPERVREPDTDKGVIKAIYLEDIRDPARTFLVGENNDGHWAVKPPKPRNAGDFKTLAECGVTPVYPGQVYGGEVYGRHSRRSTWAYLEGHALSMDLTETLSKRCFLWLDDKDKP